MKIKKAEALIFFAILCIAAVSWFVMQKKHDSKDYGSIKITVNGEEYGTYSLGTDQKIAIGETNTCRIKDGIAKMIEANCPDHLCIQQPSIDERGGMIICLPNQVVIEGIPAETVESEFELDGITG